MIRYERPYRITYTEEAAGRRSHRMVLPVFALAKHTRRVQRAPPAEGPRRGQGAGLDGVRVLFRPLEAPYAAPLMNYSDRGA